MYQYFTPFYGRMVFQCIDTSHCAFHSSVQHLGCFRSLAVMSYAAKTFVCRFSCVDMFSVLLGLYLEIEMLSHMEFCV